MKNGVNVLLVWLGLIVLSSNSHATADPVISAYAHAHIEETQRIQEKDYRLVLGKVDVVNNLVRIRDEKRIDVSGTSYLYRVTPGYSSQDAYSDVMKKLNARGANIVFSCSGRDCGDSNSWANSIFGKAVLYGKEREQNYVVAETSEQGKKLYFIAFTIKRGNGRVYLYTEELFLDGQSVQSNNLAASEEEGFLTIRFNDEATLLERVSQLSLVDLENVRHDKFKDTVSSVWLGLRLIDSSISYRQAFDKSSALLDKIKQTLASQVTKTEIRLIPLGSFYTDVATANELRIYVE